MIARLATFAAVGALAVGAGSLRPDTATLAAWNEFVTRAESDLHSCQCDAGKPQGKTYEIPGGTIHQWRGELLIKGVTVHEVVNALQSRGVPPPQEDVLESRVLSRSRVGGGVPQAVAAGADHGHLRHRTCGHVQSPLADRG